MSRRSEQNLSVKLENLIQMLPKLIKNPEFKQVKDKFPQPVKEEATNLFKFDSGSPFYQNLQIPKSVCIIKKLKLDYKRILKKKISSTKF